ncbi:uncharacterized protein [Dendrobates tinctorius]|uniref:uncharacterized protein n=1 Tax=Dendrobates tinctorius TaxID=92724 RepID=UPI003CC9BEF2
MAAASHNIPPEPEVFGYHFEIPEKAEVKRVPMSMLSSSVQQKITRLGGNIETSHVIVVSPITKQRFPSNHKARKMSAKTAAKHPRVTSSYITQQSVRRSSMRRADARTRGEQGTYLVPVKCFKDIAIAILQLSQTCNPETLSVKSELQALDDSLNVSQHVIFKMEATALYMCKNVMYLLPRGKKTEIKDEKCESREKVVKSKVTNSQLLVTNFTYEDSKQRIVPKNSQIKMEEVSRNSEGRHDDLGCVSLRKSSFLQQQNRRSESRVTIVKLWDEDLSPSNDRPSSRPSTEDEQQISYREQSEGPSKRKFHSVSNEEPSIKKICQSGHDPKSIPASSPLRPHSSSKASSLSDLQEFPPLFSDANCPDIKELSPSPHSSSSEASPLEPQDLPPVLSDANNPDLKDTAPSPYSSSSETSLEPQELPLVSGDSNSPDLKKFSPSPHSSSSQASPLELQDLPPVLSDANNPDLKDIAPSPHSSSSETSPLEPQELPLVSSDANSPDLKAFSPSPHSSSSEASSSRDPQEIPPLFSDANNPNLKEFSLSQHSSPAPPRAHPTYGDYMSPPHLEAKSSLSESSTCSEPGDTVSLHDTHPISNYLGSQCPSLLDIDDTTRDEKKLKLLARVREWTKIIDNMKQKEEVSESISEIQDVPKGELY